MKVSKYVTSMSALGYESPYEAKTNKKTHLLVFTK